MKDMIRKKENKNTDTLLVELKDSSNVYCYGREEEPCIVVYRDSSDHEIIGYEILAYEKYPQVWKKSLEALQLPY